jgi:hypothetical protein
MFPLQGLHQPGQADEGEGLGHPYPNHSLEWIRGAAQLSDFAHLAKDEGRPRSTSRPQ